MFKFSGRGSATYNCDWNFYSFSWCSSDSMCMSTPFGGGGKGWIVSVFVYKTNVSL